MKKIFFAAMAFAVLSCGGHSHEHSEEAAHEHSHVHAFTAYTPHMEFFMQHEGLVVGEKSCIMLYVTDLKNFKPVGSNVAAAILKVGDKEQKMQVETHDKGIFHFDFIPDVAGEGHLGFEVGGNSAHFHIEVHCGHNNDEAHTHEHSSDEHNHGEAHAHGHSGHDHNHGDAHAHEHFGEDHNHSEVHVHDHSGHGIVTEGKPGDISLSKEQSWKIDFATDIAAEESFAGAVKVAAKVEAVPSNFTTIVATTSGKVQFAGNLVVGKNVAAGEAVFYLEGGDVTDNDAAVKFAEAESNYELAKADFERKKLLFIDKIVSERDYQAAEAAYKQAEARFNSMKRHFGNGKVTLCSTIGGYVSELLVSNGDYVEPGTPLAKVQRNGDVNISAELPVRYAAQLSSIESVNIELPSGNVVNVEENGGRVSVVGSSVNNCNMLPFTVTVGELEGVVPGSVVTLYINSADEKSPGVTLPRTAIVEEMGSFFVFVQNSPVSFEKRSVEVGETDGYRVKIVSGVKAGERVVTKGAISLKLSQGAAALDPHAGHVH